MSTSATEARLDENTMRVGLKDGRTLGAPPAWLPRLLKASVAERDAVEISACGLHWEALYEDISVPALLAGQHGNEAA